MKQDLGSRRVKQTTQARYRVKCGARRSISFYDAKAAHLGIQAGVGEIPNGEHANPRPFAADALERARQVRCLIASAWYNASRPSWAVVTW
jgi:hypothetical protein